MKVHGFTLIEIAIVTAIVGLLAMISIPSFNKFLAKAKRTEAYMNLNAIATAQKVYRAEHGTYTADLKALGWQPEGTLHYSYGFGGAEGTNYVGGSLGASAQAMSTGNAGADAFTAVAAGDIDGDGEPDIITINQNNEVKIVQDDLE